MSDGGTCTVHGCTDEAAVVVTVDLTPDMVLEGLTEDLRIDGRLVTAKVALCKAHGDLLAPLPGGRRRSTSTSRRRPQAKEARR